MSINDQFKIVRDNGLIHLVSQVWDDVNNTLSVGNSVYKFKSFSHFIRSSLYDPYRDIIPIPLPSSISCIFYDGFAQGSKYWALPSFEHRNAKVPTYIVSDQGDVLNNEELRDILCNFDPHTLLESRLGFLLGAYVTYDETRMPFSGINVKNGSLMQIVIYLYFMTTDPYHEESIRSCLVNEHYWVDNGSYNLTLRDFEVMTSTDHRGRQHGFFHVGALHNKSSYNLNVPGLQLLRSIKPYSIPSQIGFEIPRVYRVKDPQPWDFYVESDDSRIAYLPVSDDMSYPLGTIAVIDLTRSNKRASDYEMLSARNLGEVKDNYFSIGAVSTDNLVDLINSIPNIYDLSYNSDFEVIIEAARVYDIFGDTFLDLRPHVEIPSKFMNYLDGSYLHRTLHDPECIQKGLSDGLPWNIQAESFFESMTRTFAYTRDILYDNFPMTTVMRIDGDEFLSRYSALRIHVTEEDGGSGTVTLEIPRADSDPGSTRVIIITFVIAYFMLTYFWRDDDHDVNGFESLL